MKEPLNQKFYEKMYAENRVWNGPQGFLGFLYRLLKRYELHRVPAAVSLLDTGNRLLDVGCGDGDLLAMAKLREKYREYYGIDIAKVVANRAQKRVKEKTGDIYKCFFKRANLDEKLTFTNNYFDTVTCISVLEHIFDPYFTIREINRVLKTDGKLILEVPNLVWIFRRVSVLFGVLPITAEEDGWDGGHLHYFTKKAVVELLEDNGFSIKSVGCTGIFPKILNLWPSLLGGNIKYSLDKVPMAIHASEFFTKNFTNGNVSVLLQLVSFFVLSDQTINFFLVSLHNKKEI